MKTLQEVDIQYIIFSPQNLKTEKEKQIAALVEDFWFQRWKSEFDRAGEPESGWTNHFFQQDLVAAFVCEGEVLGCHLYTFHDLNRTTVEEHEYFKYLDSEVKNDLVHSYGGVGMTMEYLCANPEFVRNSLAFSISKNLMILGMFVASEMNCSCIIGTPIDDTRVEEKLRSFGAGSVVGKFYDKRVQKFGYQLSVLVVDPTDLVTHLKQNVPGIYRRLWSRRDDLRTLDTPITVQVS